LEVFNVIIYIIFISLFRSSESPRVSILLEAHRGSFNLKYAKITKNFLFPCWPGGILKEKPSKLRLNAIGRWVRQDLDKNSSESKFATV
jgi:hypothetical protein